jgi:hypothetical protein
VQLETVATLVLSVSFIAGEDGIGGIVCEKSIGAQSCGENTASSSSSAVIALQSLPVLTSTALMEAASICGGHCAEATDAVCDITGDAAAARSSARAVTGDALRDAMTTAMPDAGDDFAEAVGPAMGDTMAATAICAAPGDGARRGLSAKAGDWLYWKCAIGDAMGTEDAGLWAVEATDAAAEEDRAEAGVF